MATKVDIQNFVQKFLPIAQQMEQKYGMPSYALLSQIAHETNFGTSAMAKNKNNFGGIAAYDSNPDAALSFKSPQDAIDYQTRIQMAKAQRPENQPFLTQHYGPSAAILADKNHSPEQVFAAMQDSKYATDPSYAQKLMTRYQQIAPFLTGGVTVANAAEPTVPPSTPNFGGKVMNPAPTPPPPHFSPQPSSQPYSDNRSLWGKLVAPQVTQQPTPVPQGLQYKGPDGQVSRINTQGQTYPSPSPVASSPVPGLNWLHDRVRSIFGI